jgi:hypothetical protein
MNCEVRPFVCWLAAVTITGAVAVRAAAQSELPPPRVISNAPPPGPIIRVLPPPPQGAAPVTANGIEVPIKGMPGVAPAPCPPDLKNWYGLRPDLRDPCATITPGAMPMPNGWYARTWNARMNFRASAERFVVHYHEWYMGGLTLGPYGETHVAGIAADLPKVPFPVEARRRVVVELLLARGIPDAERRVVVGFSEAEGYRYDDLPRGRQGAGGLRGSGGVGGFGGTGGVGAGGLGGTLGVPSGIPGY